MYGFGRDQSVSRWLRMAKRFNFVVLPKNAAGLRQPVHLGDVAGAIMSALTISLSETLILDLPGGETLAFDQMLLRSLDAHTPQARVLRIPNSMLLMAVRLAAFLGVNKGLGAGFFARLQQDWVFDVQPAERIIAYKPRAFSP
jgi:hypothetical protein